MIQFIKILQENNKQKQNENGSVAMICKALLYVVSHYLHDWQKMEVLQWYVKPYYTW
jgi:hypothetical protein